MRAVIVAAALSLSLSGCGVPVALWAAGLGACAAACAPVVGLEKDAFDYVTGQDKPAAQTPVAP